VFFPRWELVVISSRRGFTLPGRGHRVQGTHSRLAPGALGLAALGRAAWSSPPQSPHLISEAVPGSGGARVP
jgi:hypothetical protein